MTKTEVRAMYGVDDIERFLQSAASSPTMKLAGPGMIVASLCSDAQELIAAGDKESARQVLNCAKRFLSDFVIKPHIAQLERVSTPATSDAVTAEELRKAVLDVIVERFAGRSLDIETARMALSNAAADLMLAHLRQVAKGEAN